MLLPKPSYSVINLVKDRIIIFSPTIIHDLDDHVMENELYKYEVNEEDFWLSSFNYPVTFEDRAKLSRSGYYLTLDSVIDLGLSAVYNFLDLNVYFESGDDYMKLKLSLQRKHL